MQGEVILLPFWHRLHSMRQLRSHGGIVNVDFPLVCPVSTSNIVNHRNIIWHGFECVFPHRRKSIILIKNFIHEISAHKLHGWALFWHCSKYILIRPCLNGHESSAILILISYRQNVWADSSSGWRQQSIIHSHQHIRGRSWCVALIQSADHLWFNLITRLEHQRTLILGPAQCGNRLPWKVASDPKAALYAPDRITLKL